jgi:hypothetical protein
MNSENTENINIVNLVENNPIEKINETKYQSDLIEKLQSNFINSEELLFLQNYYSYFKYDYQNDFVIDLDDVWKSLDFNKKHNLKYTLEKNFTIDKDYIINDTIQNNKKSGRGGHNKIFIMLNIDTLKKLSLKSRTKKSNEFYENIDKLQKIINQIFQEIINDESNEKHINELKQKLEEKDTIITKKDSEIDKINNQKIKEIEAVIISNFPLNTECVYLGRVDNRSSKNESLIKFGHTNNLGNRVIDHRKTYKNFIVIQAFKVINKVEIENAIKTHPRISKQLRQININGLNKTEMIAYDEELFTTEIIINLIKKVIHDKTYNEKNFDRLVEENRILKEENMALKEENAKIDKIIEEHKKETNDYLLEINELHETIDNQTKIIESINKENESIYETAVVPEEDNHPKIDKTPLKDKQETEEEKLIKRFDEFVDKMCILDSKFVEHSINIECRFRLWNNRKPEKEVFHALKNYFDTRFKPKRVNGIHCYCGVKLIELEYKKIKVNSSVETFIFENCRFSDTGKVFESNLLKEYQKWRKSINLNTSDNDLVDMKSYLKENKNVLRAVIWASNGSNTGYYGISLNSEETETNGKKLTSSTAKKVEKVDSITGEILGRWDSVAQTAAFHGVCTANISRLIKSGTTISNHYFRSS